MHRAEHRERPGPRIRLAALATAVSFLTVASTPCRPNLAADSGPTAARPASVHSTAAASERTGAVAHHEHGHAASHGRGEHARGARAVAHHQSSSPLPTMNAPCPCGCSDGGPPAAMGRALGKAMPAAVAAMQGTHGWTHAVWAEPAPPAEPAQGVEHVPIQLG